VSIPLFFLSNEYLLEELIVTPGCLRLKSKGYFFKKIAEDDLLVLRSLIQTQYISRLGNLGLAADKLTSSSICAYHLNSHLLNHEETWPKHERLLSRESVKLIRNCNFIASLSKDFGEFQISDEEKLDRENIYWRLVRPGVATDVGPMHADAWFWELSDSKIPTNMARVKVWIAIHCEKGQSGFRFVEKSHLSKFPYKGEFRDGKLKPQIEIDERKLKIKLFESEPGDAIIFHDRLLHGGALGGTETRVSLEFTMLVKENAAG